jgi:hypothetical protein
MLHLGMNEPARDGTQLYNVRRYRSGQQSWSRQTCDAALRELIRDHTLTAEQTLQRMEALLACDVLVLRKTVAHQPLVTRAQQ